MANNNGPIRFRDYQVTAIANIFRLFGVDPAGPEDDPVVARCRSNGTGEDSCDGRSDSSLADRQSDDVEPPF